ncbi:hypothetical protein EZV62_025105 [Acer yangbiense]|uniref:Uncharacterized protein n=1 Tax=Acer yangbiense TaxID=1000413 RepID=A0A5C7GWZ1_9ROSI|nr:hypothetical protein EZV62_025105 [Acer yangbiense]
MAELVQLDEVSKFDWLGCNTQHVLSVAPGAAGCSDGSCVIWDFETRVITKELRDSECVAAITSVCWSKNGHCILVSAADKSLTLWDVVKGEKITHTVLQQTPLQARLHPGSSTPSLCLACPLSSPLMIVDLITGNMNVLPVVVTDLGGAVIKNIVFSRNGQYLLTNSNDRTIRIYENLLPLKNELVTLCDLDKTIDEPDGVEKLELVGSKCLSLFREFQDSITKMHWKAPCFSCDGEWVIGGSASKGEHKIYIWDRAGHLVKILEGPKEALIDLAWHPVHPIIVSVSLVGWVYIWAKDYTENWSAFATDFKELEENEEYVEREDEFDLIPETEKQDKCVVSSSKLIDGNNSGSPLSEEAGQNGQAVNHSSSPHEGTHVKKRRKPSEKGLELQAEKVRKPLKSSGRSLKVKSKSTIDQEMSNGVYGDDVSDE